MTHDERQLIIEKAEDELKSDWFNLPFNIRGRERLLAEAEGLNFLKNNSVKKLNEIKEEMKKYA